VNEPLDELYLTWLYSQVGSVKLRTRSRTYWSLLRQLYKTPFVWFVPNDDNRVGDGTELRYEFLDTRGITDPDRNWMELPCSMLEMLVGLSRRMCFILGYGTEKPHEWFWHLMRNLDLEKYNDLAYRSNKNSQEEIDEVLQRVIWRRYSPNGEGGLFPLRHPEEDQTKLEIWYQMNEYSSQTR